MLKTPQLFGAFHSFWINPFWFFFSLLNCKYQVPFILLFLLLLYCCFCNYFFSLVDRRSSGRIVYSQSQSVNTISFQSLVQEGKRNKMFHLYSLSLHCTLLFPCCPIKVVMTALFIVLYLWGSWLLFFFPPLQQKTWGHIFSISLFPYVTGRLIYHGRYCILI